VFKSVKSLVAQHLLKIFAGEGPFAVVNAKAFWPTIRETHLRFNLALRTLQAVGVSCCAVTGDHAIQRDVVKTARALAHLVVALRILKIHRFGLLGLFGFATFGRLVLDLLLGSVEFLGDLASALDQS
jgi:hypothetical protein